MKRFAKVITITVLFLIAGTNVWGQEACKRNDRKKTPLGEYYCTAGTGNLYWKSGPVKDGSIPHYYELTKEFKIDLKYYFTDPPPVQLPDPLSVMIREQFASMVDELPDKDYIMPQYKWDFIQFSDGNLILKKGYRWDGASRGVEGLFMVQTLLVNMRSSLVHDAFYDLLRFGELPPKGSSYDREAYRSLADHLYYLVAREDGHGEELAWAAFQVLRAGGRKKAKMHRRRMRTGDFIHWRTHQCRPVISRWILIRTIRKGLRCPVH
jgi:hypothetical protein